MIQMVIKPECPSMMQNEKNYAIITGHQRAKTTNSKLFNKLDCNSEQTLVNRPTPKKLTEELAMRRYCQLKSMICRNQRTTPRSATPTTYHNYISIGRGTHQPGTM